MATLPGPKLELDDSGVPLLYSRAWQIYDYMEANIEPSLYNDTHRHYRGSITEEINKDLGITPSQYSRSMSLLKNLNAVEQVERSNHGSTWILIFRPTLEDFEQLRSEQYHSRRRPSKQSIMEQRIADLIATVRAHEERIILLEEQYGEDSGRT